MLELNAVIIRHNTSLTYEVLLCKLTRVNGICIWDVFDHKDIYINRALAEQAAKQWCNKCGYFYLGIKSGYANFPFDETEFNCAASGLEPESSL